MNQRVVSESELRTFRDTLSVEMEGLVGITVDIENNMEAVETVDQEVYETIMQNYRTKLELTYQMQEIDIREVFVPSTPSLEIPRELNSLANRILLKMGNQPSFSPGNSASVSKSGRSSKLTQKNPDKSQQLSSKGF